MVGTFLLGLCLGGLVAGKSALQKTKVKMWEKDVNSKIAVVHKDLDDFIDKYVSRKAEREFDEEYNNHPSEYYKHAYDTVLDEFKHVGFYERYLTGFLNRKAIDEMGLAERGHVTFDRAHGVDLMCWSDRATDIGKYWFNLDLALYIDKNLQKYGVMPLLFEPVDKNQSIIKASDISDIAPPGHLYWHEARGGITASSRSLNSSPEYPV